MSPRRIYIDRSRNLEYARCPRSRWNSYHEGAGLGAVNLGIQPVKKSIHLVLGGAVHVGNEVLLRDGQLMLSNLEKINKLAEIDDRFSVVLDDLFKSPAMRQLEDSAVEAALKELAESTKLGVELDELEKVNVQAAIDKLASNPAAAKGESNIDCGQFGGDSAIVVDFGEFESGKFKEKLTKELVESLKVTPAVDDWSMPIIVDKRPTIELGDGSASIERDLAAIDVANADKAAGLDDYLREELAALVEGMVRAYARRRLRPLLEQFEVMEVEREGEWKLGDTTVIEMTMTQEGWGPVEVPAELWFMSRHDALLRERSTNFLYLMSFKTASQWDNRKKQEAEIDMQGLSEAVDVDNRLSLAWYKIHAGTQPTEEWNISSVADQNMQRWLCDQPQPPRVLGVRYEYLLKGPRRADKKDAEMPGRYVADSPLIRAYKQDGITSDDRRWAFTYDWFNLAGQGKRLDYRSWKKAPVWKSMPIAKWIDILDAGLVQPEAYDENGKPLDVLADQFVEPVTVFRNDDDMRDMLEQMEAQEVRVAVDVAQVQAVQDDPAAKRSALNRLFFQNRRACVYPGKCSSFDLCYGSQTLREDPIGSGLYKIREVNHPQELKQ